MSPSRRVGFLTLTVTRSDVAGASAEASASGALGTCDPPDVVADGCCRGGDVDASELGGRVVAAFFGEVVSRASVRVGADTGAAADGVAVAPCPDVAAVEPSAAPPGDDTRASAAGQLAGMENAEAGVSPARSRPERTTRSITTCPSGASNSSVGVIDVPATATPHARVTSKRAAPAVALIARADPRDENRNDRCGARSAGAVGAVGAALGTSLGIAFGASGAVAACTVVGPCVG